MPLKSLRINIALNLSLLLLLSMLLIVLVTLLVSHRMGVGARIEKARLMLTAIEDRLRYGSQAPARSWRIPEPDPLQRLLAAGGGLCVIVVSREGQRIYQGGSGCRSEDGVEAMARRAAVEGRESVRSGNLFRGIFTRPPAELVLASPLSWEREAAAGAAIVMPMEDLFARLRQTLHVLLIYAAINTIILTMLGVYRISSLTIKPIQRLVSRAEEFRDSDDSFLLPEKEDNEFRKLSKSLNRMLIHLAQDKEKLQNSVHSLEKANRDLEKAQRELIRAEKLASVGRLSAGIAHEIGNPIGIIKGYLALLKDRTITAEETTDFVVRTESEVDRIHSIIQQLLDFSRPSGEEQESVSVHAVLEELEEVCHFQPALASMHLALHLEAGRERVVANARQLRQVFLNLALNAADAVQGIDEKGALEIFTETTDDHWIAIRFVDNGGGIPEADLTNIFDPFFTTKPPGKGTGLGLSVSFTIIEGLGGSIKAERNTRGGTSMVIKLPLAGSSSSVSDVIAGKQDA